MENTVKFSELYIGTPDGETESKNSMFEQLFCDYNNRYEELMKVSAKFLVIGSKGSGKTYLANYICKKNEKNGYTNIISGKDFLIEKLGELSQENMEVGYMYAFCSWYIYKKIAEVLISLHPKMSRYNIVSPYYKLRKFYDEYSDKNDIFKVMRKTTTNGTTREHGAGGVCNKKKDSGSTEVKNNINFFKSRKTETVFEFEKKKFYELLDNFENLILRAIDKKQEICLIIDDLDELDRTINEHPENNVTINLIKAAKEINNKFYGEEKNVKVILLVRSDIINKLQMYDMNLSKIKSSCGIELYWLTNTQVSPEQHPLMHLVLHKIKTSCPKLQNYTEKELFAMLFPDKIDGKPPLDFLLDHSFGRPRDIITYLNHVIEQYPENTAFTAVGLKNVKKLYASDFYDELVNQAYYHRSPDYTKDCIALIAGLKRSSFTVEQVKKYFDDNRQIFPHITDCEDALKFLYEMGVIGNVWNSGKNSSWSYRKDSLDEIDLTKKITVHYGIRKKFSIT